MRKFSIQNQEYLVLNLKDGDVLGFYSNKIGSKVISFFTGARIDHVGIVYEVWSDYQTTRFMFSEQTIYGGKYRKIEFKNGDIFSAFPKKKIFYGELKKLLNRENTQKGIDDAKSQEGKKYGFLTLPFGMECLNNMLPIFLQNLIKRIIRKNDTKRVCSTHVAINMLKNNSITFNEYEKDFFYTPKDVMNLKILNRFEICKKQ